MSSTRLVSPDDAPTLACLQQTNREFLAPWEPLRPESFFTVDAQRDGIEAALKAYEQGMALPHVILDESGRLVGRITLNGIVRGAFQSCSLGYWVGAGDNGRGIATSAVHEIKKVAFDELGLHRIQAETLPHNDASQRVLERNGFVRYGFAPEYLKIAGRWQDFTLFQVLQS